MTLLGPVGGVILPPARTVALESQVSGVLPIANGGTGAAVPYSIAGIPLTGAKMVVGRNASLTVGNNTLYTVPAGKKAVLIGFVTQINPTGGSIAMHFGVNIGGTMYRLSSNASVSPGTTTNQTAAAGFCLKAGHLFVVNDGTGGASSIAAFIEFDDTVPIFTNIITAVAASNTIYTCPANKTARILRGTGVDGDLSVTGTVTYVNQSGGAITRQCYSVPSGGAAGATNRLNPTAGTSVPDATAVGLSYPSSMAAGDSIVLDLSGTGGTQLLAVSYTETPV